MRTTFLVRQALWPQVVPGLLASLLAGCAVMPAGVDRGLPALNLDHRAGKAALKIRFPRAKAQILPLDTDAKVDPASGTATVELVASAWSNTLLVQDTYASKPGPLSMCQAGQESFLRVIRLAPLKEILSVKLASCHDNIELASPGLEWHADTGILKIRWLSDVNHLAHERTLQIARDGSIVFVTSVTSDLLKY